MQDYATFETIRFTLIARLKSGQGDRVVMYDLSRDSGFADCVIIRILSIIRKFRFCVILALPPHKRKVILNIHRRGMVLKPACFAALSKALFKIRN